MKPTLNLYFDFKFTSLSPDAQVISCEKWCYVNGYNKKYAISSKGRILSFSFKKPILMRPNISNSGYKYVCLSLGNKKKSHFVHRIVAEHFIDNFNKELTVNHLNGIKTDNDYSNLECVTQSENSKHAFRLGLITPSNRGVFTRVEQLSINGDYIKTHNSMSAAANELKTTMPNIRGAVYGINGQKTAMGYRWNKCHI